MQTYDSVNGTLLRFYTRDNLALHGLLTKSKENDRKVIAHVHGMTGNFYSWFGSWKMSKTFNNKGYDFFTFNTRGAGVISYFKRKIRDKETRFTSGTAFERFGDCVKDISGAMDLLRKIGYREIVLSGHSTGCQKITYYQGKVQDRNVNAIILLAPVDDFNSNRKELGDNFQKVVNLAKNMINTGRGNELLPEETKIPFRTARRFVSVADPRQAEAKTFNYESKRLTYFSRIKCPVFAVFGDKEEYRTKPVSEYIKKLQHDTTSRDFGYAIIEGADHGFTLKEEETAKAVVDWLDKRLNRTSTNSQQRKDRKGIYVLKA